MAGKYKKEEAEYYKLLESPEYKIWEAQGRITPPGLDTSDQGKHIIHGYNALVSQLSALKAEDRTTSNYYELATGQKATPEVVAKYAQYAYDPALLQAAIGKEATLAPSQGKYKDIIGATINDKLGRQATDAELGYFGKQMEAGNLDAYGLQQFLGGTTEYQTKASDVARGKLATELGGVDDAYMAKTQKALEAKYASQGRSGSSAFGSALIGAGKDLASQRTGYLAGLGYQDFQQGQGNLTAAYNNQLQSMYNQHQANTAYGAESRSRYYSNQDYAKQQAAAERLARLGMPKTGSFFQNVLPGVIQAGSQIGAAAITASDRRCKKDIVKIGSINGQNVYSFKYISDNTEHIGVMSDEVRHIPGAVIAKDGQFDMVNYEKVLEHLAKGDK